jgi:hypothetical protein
MRHGMAMLKPPRCETRAGRACCWAGAARVHHTRTQLAVVGSLHLLEGEMGAYNLLLVVTLLGLCARCTLGVRGTPRGAGLSGNISPLEVELEGLELGDVREKAAAGGAFVG